jgi:hypothetical protein
MESGKKRPRSGHWHISGWPAILLAPLLFPVALIFGLFSKPAKRTPAEVAGFLRDFIDGTGGDWDWDDFTSVRLANPELDAIRQEADMVALPVTPEGERQLKVLLARAEVLKTAWLEAGQPD